MSTAPLVSGHEHTVLVVLYRTPVLDLSGLPAETPVVLVHNDDALREVRGEDLHPVHVRTGRNVGFGAGVNAGLAAVRTARVVLHNPDVRLRPEQWSALTAPASEHEVVTLPQADEAGAPASVVNRYPGPLVTLLQLLRVGRLAPRDSRRRSLLTLALGRYGAAHRDLLPPARERRLSLAQHWVTGSLVSVDTARLRAVGGFDEGYFLYVEDVDLCRRLAVRFPDSELVLRPARVPALHSVGGSSSDAATRRLVRRAQLRSARRYAASCRGPGWTVLRVALAGAERAAGSRT